MAGVSGASYVSGASSSSLVPSSTVIDSCESDVGYDVFINSRESDVHVFSSYLHNSLVSRGLRVFLDKKDLIELQARQSIPSQIKNAIRGASLIITIFSPNYAESQGCLEELLLALFFEKTIFPVFYRIKPDDLRRGRYAEDLMIHELNSEYDPITHEQRKRFDYQTIENWRTALSAVAKLHGFDLEAFDGDEAELAEKVVQTVLEKFPKASLRLLLRPPLYVANYPTGLDDKIRDTEISVLREKPPLYVAKYPTGLDDKIQDTEISVLRKRLGEDRVEARVVGIVGLAGVGKTTMAKEFFNRHKSDYKTHSFLFDVGVNAATKNLNSLQSHLIKDMSGLDVQIGSRDEDISILAANYSNYQALVILDGVDHVDQLDAFLPIKGVLHPDSLILVTSRDRGVLTSAGIVESSIYHLRGLSREHSLQLFCSHAFSQPYPPPEFRNLADRFIDECNGLPLSLKVMGDLVSGQNEIRYWKNRLDKLNKILPSDIYSTLRISYDSLDEEEQQIFLDIACFCIGDDRDRWIRIWDASGWEGFQGFRTLQDKCLVEVNSTNIIIMHNHLRVMGRNIAASSRSMARRLWQPIYNVQDINDMLMQSSPNPEVRGLRMTIEHKSPSHDVAGKRKRQSANHDVLEMRKLQLLEAQGDFVQSILTRVQSPNLIWLYWHDCPCRFLHSWIPMQDLRVLKVNSLELQTLWEHEYQAPLELRELIIDAPLVKFPESLGKLKHLEKIVATRTSLETLPEEFYFPSLEYLELESCKLTKLWQNEYKAPPQLRRLIIEAPLVEFPKSLELLKHLEYIVGKWPCVATFPEEFNLPSLKYLELHGCKFQKLWQCKSGAPLQLTQLIIDAPIVEFPKSLRQLKHLEKIVAKGTCLETFPEDFNLPSLEYLELDSRKFQRLWQSDTEAPMGLRELIIDAPLVEFPESLWKLTKLEKIVAKGTCLETFPEDFNLTSLKYLELDGCKFERLWQNEFQAPPLLKELIIDAPLVEFPNSWTDLEKIVAKGICLETFPEYFYAPSLKYLELDSLKLQRLWQSGFEVPMQLRELIIDAPLIEFPQSLGQLKHLEKLVAKGACLERFPEKFNLPSLKYLELDICKFQRLWQSESEVPLQLRELIIDAPLVEFPKSLVQLKHLEKIVAKWTCLETFPEEFNLPSLKYLELDSLKFQRLWQSKTEAPLQLRELIIYAPLVEFPHSLGRLMHLEKLVAKGTCLETFPEEFDLPSLKYLELDGCKFQRLWQSESGVPLRLRELIIDAPLVEFPKSLGKLKELEKIVAKGTCLEAFPEEFDLPSLKYLELDGCIFQRLWQSESGVPLQLRELIIDAPLVEFPKSLGKLIELEKIVAKGTCLETFPEEFDLPSLKYLELDGCKFQRLWQSESGIPLQLRELITDAPLVEFPKSLGQLKQLEKLVAEETNLRTLPKEFCYLPCLKYLKLKDYKMHIPPNSAGDVTSPQFSQFERSQNFPDSMDNLTNLEIDLQQCRSLEMLLTAISWSQSQIPSGK